MPSPFPGMDPYLEAPDLWPDVHHDLITQVRSVLTPELRPTYFAKVESRTYVVDNDDPGVHLILPDVMVVRRLSQGRQRWDPPASSTAGGGGVAVAESIDVTDLLTDELSESLIEIRETASRQLVTVIEVVSPTNKVRGSAGHESFDRKRRDCVASGVHWVEIDLLRAGEWPTAAGIMQPADYRVFRDANQADNKRRRQAWPWKLRDAVPVVGIPLLPEHGQVALDLGTCLRTVYEDAGYDMMIDYAADPPEPPLSNDDAAWLDALLREAKLRD